MKKNVKRIMALLLCLTMCFNMASPVLAVYYAAGTVVEDDGSEKKCSTNRKRTNGTLESKSQKWEIDVR